MKPDREEYSLTFSSGNRVEIPPMCCYNVFQ